MKHSRTLEEYSHMPVRTAVSLATPVFLLFMALGNIFGIGVAMKINMITGMISMGIGQGIQPLLGYCTGSKEWNRFRNYMKFSVLFSFLISAVLTLLCFLFTNQLASLFLSNAAAASYAVKFSRILISSVPICGIFFVLLYAL